MSLREIFLKFMLSIYILTNIKHNISKNVKDGESVEGVMDSKKIEVLNVKKLKNVNVSRQSIYNFIKRNCMEKSWPRYLYFKRCVGR